MLIIDFWGMFLVVGAVTRQMRAAVSVGSMKLAYPHRQWLDSSEMQI